MIVVDKNQETGLVLQSDNEFQIEPHLSKKFTMGFKKGFKVFISVPDRRAVTLMIDSFMVNQYLNGELSF